MTVPVPFLEIVAENRIFATPSYPQADQPSLARLRSVLTQLSPSPPMSSLITCIGSLPVVGATVCRIALSVIDTGFLGHLSTQALAASSIASTIMFIVLNGISGAAACINALGAQCYGAGNKQLVGVWLQIAVVCCSIAAVPAIVLFMFVEPMLKPIIQDAEVRHLAGEFARWSALSIWPASM